MQLGVGLGVSQRRESGAAPVALSLLTNYSYIIPWAGKDINAALNTVSVDTSYNIDLRPSGPDQGWTSMRIGFRNYGSAYSVQRAYVARTGMTAFTGDKTTGYIPVATSPVSIASGTNIQPKTTWLTEVALDPSGGNRFQLACQIAAGSPIAYWGEFPNRAGIGWIPTYHEQLPTNLSDTLSISGGDRAWNGSPLIVVEFKGHATTVVSAFIFGDSTTYGMGDEDQGIGRPYGFVGRLESRIRAGNARISPVNLGHPGMDTDQINQLIQATIADFPLRMICRQFDSVNSVAHSKPSTDTRADLATAEAIMGLQPVIPYLGPGGNAIVDHPENWQTPAVAERTWVKANRTNAVTGTETRVTNATTLAIAGGYVLDNVHLNNAGYTAFEEDTFAQFKAAIDAKAGITT